MNNVKREEMLALPVPLSAIAEQKVIIQRVEKSFFMVDELEKQVSERKEQSEQLMQAVLREAFEGGN
jgi:restriction endonuclease S subunit